MAKGAQASLAQVEDENRKIQPCIRWIQSICHAWCGVKQTI